MLVFANRKGGLRAPSAFSPLFIIVALQIIYTLGTQQAYGKQNQRSEAKNAKNPLIYKRLRFDDNFLRLFNRFQKEFTTDEKKVAFKVSEASQADGTNGKQQLVDYSYYENNEYDAKSFHLDDVIFEALDQTYLGRLNQHHVYNYASKQQKIDAADRKLISPKRCKKEMNFLMKQLKVMEEARYNDSATAGFQMSNELSMEVAALFDAFGTEEPGLLLGNYVWSGNWRHCQKSRVFFPDTKNPSGSVDFKSRYCIATLRSPRWDKLVAARIPQLEKRLHFKYPEQKYEYAKFHRIHIGMCIPESCDSTILDDRHKDIERMVKFKLSQPMQSYDLTDLFCIPDETSKFRELEPSGRILVQLILLWLAAMFLASVYDYRCHMKKAQASTEAVDAFKQTTGSTKKKSTDTNAAQRVAPAKPPALSFIDKMVDSLSLIRNIHRLIETRSCQPPPSPEQEAAAAAAAAAATQASVDAGKPGQVSMSKIKPVGERNMPRPSDLLFLNFIKNIPVPIFILSHVGMLYKQMDRFPLDFDAISKDVWVSHFFYSTVFFCDWFFTMTAFLITYNMFATKRVERNNLGQWIYLIVHRYLRLAPLYVLTTWFAKDLFIHTSYGPVWDYGTSNMTFRAICRESSYLWSLTLTSNFHPIHQECVMTSWYISNDFQFFLVTPIFLLLLYKSALLGWLTTLGTIGACVALRSHRYLTDPRVKPLDLMRPRYDLLMRNSWDMHPTYLYPQYRIASYLVGILAGHYTYKVLSGEWTSPFYYDRSVVASSSSSSSSNTKVVGAKSDKEEAKIKKRKDCIRLSLWILGFVMAIIVMFITKFMYDWFPEDLEKYSRYITAMTYSVSHLNAAISINLILVTFMFGQFSSLRRFMSKPIWTVLSRINFFTFLIQIEVIAWTMQSRDRRAEFNGVDAFRAAVMALTFTFPLATILTVLFELPSIHLERNFIGPIAHLLASKPKPQAPITEKSAKSD